MFRFLDNFFSLYYNQMVNSMLENLNPEQLRAVTTTDGAVLVLAGAGTGKTRVLTSRIAYILANNMAMPWQIMALTFTNRAANEMKTRIAGFSDGTWNAADVWCGTFHSMCLRILRANSAVAGLRRDFLILGEDEQKAVLKSVLNNMGLDVKDFNPGDWVERISSIKDRGLAAVDATTGITNKIITAYNAELDRLGAVDFGDIILRVLDLFDKNPDVLARYQRQFKYIMVDEFQDVNSAQMDLLLHLMPADENQRQGRYLLCVGDDDQSIYSWRGAEIKHILGFQKYYGNIQIIIDINYRSTGNILGAANSLIAKNSARYQKALRPCPDNGAGEAVYIVTVPSDLDEARLIADAIVRDGLDNLSRFAVLIRTGSLSRVLEEEFATRGIAYRLVGATKFYDRMEIRDAIAYIRLLVYPFDEMSFMRVIGRPRRGFGDAAIAKIRANGTTMFDGMRNATLSAKQRAAADEFIGAFDFDWRMMSPRDAAQKILEDSGYLKMWRESKDVDASERINNIRELIGSVISKYDSLPEFLEQAALMVADDDANADAQNSNVVRIMTIHAAKGLEFHTVFLPAWEEGLFPNEKSVSEGSLEEERRLGYVAITRARVRCVISNAMSRVMFGQRQYNSPSRFITEMDNKYLEFVGGVSRPSSYQPKIYSAPAAPRPTRAYTAQKTKSIVGALVSHEELGRGVVIEDAGDILTVAWRSHGIKKVARQFVRVEK